MWQPGPLSVISSCVTAFTGRAPAGHPPVSDTQLVTPALSNLPKSEPETSWSGSVGWPGGISPPGSHRSRRDSLPSPGSSCSYHQAPVTGRPGAWRRRGEVADGDLGGLPGGEPGGGALDDRGG